MRNPRRRLLASLALLAVPTLADIPLATHLFVTNNGSAVYQLSHNDLQFLNISEEIDASKSHTSKVAELPFLDSQTTIAFTPIPDENGLNVVASDCGSETKDIRLWHYTPKTQEEEGSWEELPTSATGSSISAQFLSAGFSFSSTASAKAAKLYLFGGMCPNTTSAGDDWITNASYNNDMVVLTPDPSSVASYPQTSYKASVSAARGPPVAEAGLTITPLTPSYSESSPDNKSQQQDFVLLGGHTQQAFINMSQVAIFSLPQATWSYQAIAQPDSQNNDLMVRSTSGVEPRSGHTAVLSADGSQIVVFGGWVGDTSTPAEPQLAVLELGQGYGGDGQWRWTIPKVSSSPLQAGQGVFGHGAAMLDGGVMLISGGYSISSSSSKIRRRSLSTSDQTLLFNVSSSTFVNTYANPAFVEAKKAAESKPKGGALHTGAQKAGLSAGLVLGLLALAGIIAFYIFYSRRLHHKQLSRDKEVREMALGPDRLGSGEFVGGGVDGRGGYYPNARSASWGSRQERRIGSPSDDYPWAPVAGVSQHGGDKDAERTGLSLEIPSPTRGLRKSLHTRGGLHQNPIPASPGHLFPTSATGEIHTIDEEDESKISGSLRRPRSSKSRGASETRPISGESDPFKDPRPDLVRSESETGRMNRQKEIKGWVEDWEAAGAALDSGRKTAGSNHDSNNSNARSGSPEKSDRTESNLSDGSTMSSSSIQRSLFGTISRNVSLRSASAGYALFANAAAAMTGRATVVNHPGPASEKGSIARTSSKRSVSLNLHHSPSTQQRGTVSRATDRTDTFSSTHTTQPNELDALLIRPGSSRQTYNTDHDAFETPPESPVKERYGSMTSATTTGRKALGWMGGMRRALTGVASSSLVKKRVDDYESKNGGTANSTSSSPIKDKAPQMVEVASEKSPRRAASASAALWRGKKGARDWDAEPSQPSGTTSRPILVPGPSYMEGSGTVLRRKPVPLSSDLGAAIVDASGLGTATSAAGPSNITRTGAGPPRPPSAGDDGEWDVEAAVQRRLVQVMFTVPKEKLRVVNVDADQLSVVSTGVSEAGGETQGEGIGNGGGGGSPSPLGPGLGLGGRAGRVSRVVEEDETGESGQKEEEKDGRIGKGKSKKKE